MTSKNKKTQNSAKTAEYWVGIGASAGGLEALRGLVRSLSSDLPVAYMVTQHIAPQHRSMLTEIIGRETELEVIEAKDNEVPVAGVIYVTPPNRNLLVQNGRLQLSEPAKNVATPKPSVNVFFSSLAKDRGSKAIGIILSGTGSDGALGIKDIRKAGGITIAQDYMTAKYSSMPVAAVETGCIDLVMSPEELSAQMGRIIETPRNLEVLRASPVNMDSVSELIQLLLDQTKVNFRHYKTATFQRRVERRIAALNLPTLEKYVKFASSSTEEVDALFQDLLITVTSFFRDAAEFEALGKYVQNIIKDKPNETIRVWVAGSATGEEAYTIAMMFAEGMGGPKAFANAKIQIFATDVDKDAIEVARRGYYPEPSLNEVPEEIVERYFESAPVGMNVNKVIRDKIVFSVHNIAQDPPFLNLDLITCRNLLIYFQTQLQAQVLARFHYSLVPRGILFLGKSESVTSSEQLFQIAEGEKHIFRQRPSQDSRALRNQNYQRPKLMERKNSLYPPPELRELEIAKSQFSSLIRSVGPNCLMVNSDLQVTMAFGDVSRYAGIAAGVVQTTTSSLLREPYRQDVRASVPAVIRNKEPYIGIVRQPKDDPTRRERIKVFPIENTPDSEVFALVVFEDWQESHIEDSVPESGTQVYQEQVKTLTRELEIARSNLMQMIEELETSNEELQALNEELQSSNEELQSTNEEMETSNEELQSTNEELSTVNEELQVNAQQLNSLNQSLRSILENVAIPMLVVDRDMNITHVSRPSEAAFGVAPDVTLPHVSRCKLPANFPNLVKILNQAMTSGLRVDRHIEHEDMNATLTVVPHFVNQDELAGGIILLADNTDELKDTRNELQLIFDNLPASIIVRDEAGKLHKVNKATSQFMERSIEDLENASMKDLYTPERVKEATRADQEAIKTGQAVSEQYITYTSPSGIDRIFNTSRIPFRANSKSDTLIYAMALDVTEEYHTRKNLEKSEARLDEAAQIAGVGHWELDIASDEVFWSHNFETLLGFRVGNFSGSLDDFYAHVHSNDLPEFQSLLKTAKTKGDDFNIELRLLHQKGHSIWVNVIARALKKGKKKPTIIQGTVQDITERKQYDLEIKGRNSQLQLASEMAGLGYWKYDVKADSLFWSSQMYRIHGVDEETYSVNLRAAKKFYHEDDRERFVALLEDAQKKGSPFKDDGRIVRSSGEVRYVSCIADVEKNSRNEVLYVYGALYDVTEDRLARAALARSEERLDQAIKTSGLGFWEWDLSTNVEYWSPRYKELIGYKSEDKIVSYEDFKKLLHPDDSDRVLQATQAHLDTAVPYKSEYRLKHKEGHYIWVQDNARASRDSNNRALRMIGTIEDITERKLRSLHLRELNERWTLAAKLSAMGYWKIDLVENTLDWSEEIYKIHKVSPETFTPSVEAALKFYHEDDRDFVTQKIQSAIEDAKPFDFEARLVLRDNDQRMVSAKSSVDLDETGRAVSIFGVFRDITKDREREAALKALLDELSRSNEELNRFSYVCSHDMKEPVRMIEAMSEMLLDPKILSDHEQRDELLNRINTNMSRLRGIIDSLLAYSRVEAKVEFTAIPLDKVMEEVMEALSLNIAEQDAEIDVGKMPVIHGARVHFVQLFQNLLGNAMKHANKEEPHVRIRSKTKANKIIITVEDDGPGIPKASQDRVFELFGRLKRRDETDGTGLGLSICKKIVNQYEGTIECSDSELGGAKFTIELPKTEGE